MTTSTISGAELRRLTPYARGVVRGQALLEYALFLAIMLLTTYIVAPFFAASLQAWYEAALAPLIVSLDGRLAK